MDFGCAAYCQYAEQCLGTLPPEVAAQQENLLRDRVAIEMKRYFKKDFKRIGHAMRVARHAERIGKAEGGYLAVVLSAAFLHDIGIPAAEGKYKSSAPEYQEKEGPEVARSILVKLGAPEKLIDSVCDIVGHHHRPRTDDTVEFKIVYDSDWIANMEEKLKTDPLDRKTISESIEAILLTEGGRITATEVLLNN
jgi:HD superfamily phosphodiesterase